MTKHFLKELEKIKSKILSLGALVEDRVRLAVKSVDQRDSNLADQVIKTDHQIDEIEVEIEEECLKVLALHQPVAVDLRFLIAVIKINNDLERIGDQAVNIAQRTNIISNFDNEEFFFDFNTMADKTEKMLKMSLDALVNLDIDLSFKILTLDDEVDQIKKEAYDEIKKVMKKSKGEMAYLINLLLISRHLERIADHATNIAEEVIYLIEGEIVRHGKY